MIREQLWSDGRQQGGFESQDRAVTPTSAASSDLGGVTTIL